MNSNENEMSWKARALYALMSDISEDCYCAGWMSGNEYTLWEMVADKSASRKYGQDTVTEDQINDLRAISSEINGWIVWGDDGGEFVPMPAWLRMYELQKETWEAAAK